MGAKPITIPDGISPVHAISRQASLVDFPDRMAALLFLQGCNFRCGFCHNPSLLSPGTPDTALPWTTLKAHCDAFKHNWVDAVVVTGGEPTLHPDLPTLLQALKSWGFHIKLDTNGSCPDVLGRILPHVDYVAMDIKFAPEDYSGGCHFPHCGKIADSIDILKHGGIPYEFRTTILPQWHTPEKMEAIGRWIHGAPKYVLQAFVPRDGLLEEAYQSLPATSTDDLNALRRHVEPFVQQVQIRGEYFSS